MRGFGLNSGYSGKFHLRYPQDDVRSPRGVLGDQLVHLVTGMMHSDNAKPQQSLAQGLCQRVLHIWRAMSDGDKPAGKLETTEEWPVKISPSPERK